MQQGNEENVIVRTNVIKRNGQEVTFDITKIINAIGKANHEVAGIHQMNNFQIRAIADNIAKKVSNYPHAANVEDIQDMVETGIMEMRGYEVGKLPLPTLYGRNLQGIRSISRPGRSIWKIRQLRPYMVFRIVNLELALSNLTKSMIKIY